MKTNNSRIRNIIGQLKAVERMIGEERDCIEVLTQLKAARSAIESLMAKYIEAEVRICSSKRSSVRIAALLKELTK